MRGATRGDGVRGEDVTPNVRTIRAIPLALDSGAARPDRGPRRGLPAARAFARINAEREDEGEPLFANPRNAAAGTMRNLDPALVARRRRLGARITYSAESVRSEALAADHAMPRLLEAMRALGPAGRGALPALHGHRRGDRVLPGVGRQAPRAASSTPTASSSSWTTWRCASGSARPPSSRAGRPRSSFPRSRRTRSC